MSENLPGGKSPYKFENDVSGRLFVWCIESGQIDLAALVEGLGQEEAEQKNPVKRLALALEQAVGEHANWASERPPAPRQGTRRLPSAGHPLIRSGFAPAPRRRSASRRWPRPC